VHPVPHRDAGVRGHQQRLGDKVQIVGITDDPNRDAAKQAAATKVTYPSSST
jgi:hypothetical protein